MLKKLIIVYNPRSSRHAVIEQEVLAPVRKITGWIVSKYEVRAVPLAENAKRLAKIISDGDLVVAVGGDGTASLAANGVLDSKKQATLAVMGYGNLNDVARIMKIKRPVEYGESFVGGLTEVMEAFEAEKITDFYPLDVRVDGEHWRFAMCYATVGLLAEAAEMMDDKAVRKKLNTGKCGPLYSLVRAVAWYLKNKWKEFLPAGSLVRVRKTQRRKKLEGVEMRIEGRTAWATGTTDYLAVNGPTMARLMKGGRWYLEEGRFGSATKSLGKFWKMVGFGLRSVLLRLKLTETEGDVLEFAEKASVEIQVEGEYERLEDVKEIQVAKTGQRLRVIKL